MQPHARFPSGQANNFQVMQMCSAFAGAGVDTTLVVASRAGARRALERLPVPVWEYYGVTTPFTIDWLPFPYPFRTLQRSVHALAVAAYAASRRPPLVYTRSEWAAMAVSRLRIPTVLELHHLTPGAAQRFAAGEARRSAHLLAVVAVSRALAAAMVDRGFPASKVTVAADGVDLERFEPALSMPDARRLVGLDIPGPVVCHLGHLYQGRGIDILLRAAQTLPEVTFVFVGGNREDIARHQADAAAAGLRNVRFVGIVPNALVPRYLYAADLLVMPYTRGTSTHEFMSPMKMFEYMASGRPVVASEFPVLREVLESGRTVEFVPPSDPGALSAAIAGLLADPARARALGAAAKSQARGFAWSARTQRILQFINERYEHVN